MFFVSLFFANSSSLSHCDSSIQTISHQEEDGASFSGGDNHNGSGDDDDLTAIFDKVSLILICVTNHEVIYLYDFSYLCGFIICALLHSKLAIHVLIPTTRQINQREIGQRRVVPNKGTRRVDWTHNLEPEGKLQKKEDESIRQPE
jgi:hypothetical protein